MSSLPDIPEKPLPPFNIRPRRNLKSFFPFLALSLNVYILLTFTVGKGFQLSIANLNLNYYVHSLGYATDFIGVFSAMPAVGALVGAIPVGMLADRWGKKSVLLLTAFLTPLFLALIGLVASAPLLLLFSFLQGLVSTGYWVTNLPLLIDNTSKSQRVGVLALNSFLLLGVGSLGNLIGGAIPEYVGSILGLASNSPIPLRWSVFSAALFTFIFGFPLWFLRVKKGSQDAEEAASESTHAVEEADEQHDRPSTPPKRVTGRLSIVLLFLMLLIPDLLFTMGEGAVVALMQVYFVLRFDLLPGNLGVIFTFSGLIGGVFSLLAPLFVKRWSKLKLITSVQYISAPVLLLIGFAPVMTLALVGEYLRTCLRMLIEPVYAAFAMEQVPARLRGMLAGWYSVTWSVGFSLGPSAAGWLQKNVSLSTSFLFGAICLLVAPTLLLLFFRRQSTVSPVS